MHSTITEGCADMENNIATLCEELQAAREAKKNLQAQMEELDELISQLKDDVALALTEQGLDQCVTGGYSYTVHKSFKSFKDLQTKGTG